MRPLKVFLTDRHLALNGTPVIQLLYDSGIHVLMYFEDIDHADVVLMPFYGRNRVPPDLHAKTEGIRGHIPVAGIEIDEGGNRSWPVASFDFRIPSDTHPAVFVHALHTISMKYHEKATLLKLRNDHDRRIQEMSAMVEMGIEFMATLSRADLIAAILNRTASFIPAELYLLMVFDERTSIADLRGHIESVAQSRPLPRTVRFSQDNIDKILRLKGPVFDQNPFSKYPFLRLEAIRLERMVSSIMFVPIITKDKLLGYIDIINHTGTMGFTDSDSACMEVLSDFAAVAMENALLYEKTEMLTETDDLTGVQNFDFAAKYIKRLTDVNDTFSMLFLDLDGFKQVNSRYGHLKGNDALRRIAEIIRECIRPSDLASRFGGDEFVIVMPGRDLRTARAVSRKIIKRIETEPMFPDIKLSASIGIALFPDDGDSIRSVIQKADAAMYKAKARGKGTIISYRDIKTISSGDTRHE